VGFFLVLLFTFNSNFDTIVQLQFSMEEPN